MFQKLMGLLGRTRTVFDEPPQPITKHSGTRQKHSINRTKIKCPFCPGKYTLHGMKVHWRRVHPEKLVKRNKYWTNWLKAKRKEHS